MHGRLDQALQQLATASRDTAPHRAESRLEGLGSAALCLEAVSRAGKSVVALQDLTGGVLTN